MKPLLVGELNPYGDDDHFALYPLPKTASGWRLCSKIMGLNEDQYIERFERANLCYRRWSVVEARRRSQELMSTAGRTIVLLGSKVCHGFGVFYAPYSTITVGTIHTAVILPHPSGLNREWHKPGSFDRARKLLVETGVLTPV